MKHNIYHNEEAVSEVIGFIYIFAIVILSMSFIFVVGYPMLQSSMDESIFESTSQSFIVLQSNMKMVGFDQVPVKSMKIQLNGATISATRNSNLIISTESETIYNGEIGEIEYQKNDKSLTFENGGVWKRYPYGSIMISGPRIYTGKDKNVINFTTIGVISMQGGASIGGKGIAIMSMKYNDSGIYKSLTPVNVTLRINSTQASDWEKFLGSIDFSIINSTDSSLIAQRNETMLVVGKHMVDVDIT
jgi:hypothetical protein